MILIVDSREYYVDGWFNLDWGVYFYIGRGKGDRYKSLGGRSKAFEAIVSHWDCEPYILADRLTLDEAEFLEKNRKHYLLFDLGHPILDGEPSDLRAMAQAEGIAAMPVDERGKKVSRKTGRGFGRQEKRPENFEDILRRQRSGELTLKEAMAEAGIGRTKWYELARENSCRA